MVSVIVHCPRCQLVQIYRHGQSPKSSDRFRCRDCHCVFLLTGVLAYTFGSRIDETCRELLAFLTLFKIGLVTRDD